MTIGRDSMARRNTPAVELRAVPENEKLAKISDDNIPPPPAAAGRSRRSNRTSAGDSAAPLGTLSTRSRFMSGAGGSNNKPLGRTSMMQKMQASGKNLVDLGRLQANWVSKTLTHRVEAQDIMGEGEQGVAALLARHVELDSEAWQALLSALGATDGHFWSSTLTRGQTTSVVKPKHFQTQASRDRNATAPGDQEIGQGQSLCQQPRRSIYYLPVLDPYNIWAVLWSFAILMLDMVYTAFWVPMNVAFCTASYGDISRGCTQSDLVGGALYTLNVILGFQIGVVATHGYRKRSVTDGPLVARLYIRHGRFLLDFISSIPFIYLIVVIAGRSSFSLGDKSWVNAISLIRLVRMLRLVSISKLVYMDSLSGRFQDSPIARVLSVSVIYSFCLAYMLSVALNLLACIMVLCAYFEGYENSWMSSVTWTDVPDASQIYQWYCALYWMIVTATTTGFGDFQPRSTAEQVVANIAMIGGMVLFGVLVAIIGNALARATAEAHKVYGARRRISHVKEWAEQRSLPAEMCKAVQNFYGDKYARKDDEYVDGQVMAELPSNLRNKVARSLCAPLVADVHILMELPEDLQGIIAENLRPVRLPAGEDLCQQGDMADCLWILQEGRVQAVRYKEGSAHIDAVDATPRLIGESLLLGENLEACRVRPWTLRTVLPCRLWRLQLSDLLPMLRMYPQLSSMAAEYIKYKTVFAFNNDRTDEHWCELAAAFVTMLRTRTPPDQAAELVKELFAASSEDGSLLAVLEELLSMCSTKGSAAAAATALMLQERCSRPTLDGSTLAAMLRRPTAEGLIAAATAAAPAGSAQGQASTAAPTSVGNAMGAAGPFDASAASGPAAAAAATIAAAAAMLGRAAAAQGLAAGAGRRSSTGEGEKHAEREDKGGAEVAGPRLSASGSAPVPGGGAPGGSTLRKHSAGQLSTMSAGMAGATGAGPGSSMPPAGVQCPGCQRHVCPSCGQGTDTPVTTAAVLAAAANFAAGGASTQPFAGRSGAAPVHAPAASRWSSMRGPSNGNVSRRSISSRPDQVWAMGRISFDRHRELASMSVAPSYD